MKCISKLYHNTFTDYYKKFVFHIFVIMKMLYFHNRGQFISQL